MGSWLTHMWWGGDPDSPHPLSNLTLRDVYAVQRSWAPVYANSVANGTEILRRLYKDYPETKEFFKMVRKVDDENAYADNPQFKAHVINLMAALSSAIGILNQPEVVKAMMQKLGESHQKRKIQQKHFMYLKDVLVKMFIEVLKLDEFTLSAWAKTVDFWYACIFEKLDQPPATSTDSR